MGTRSGSGAVPLKKLAVETTDRGDRPDKLPRQAGRATELQSPTPLLPRMKCRLPRLHRAGNTADEPLDLTVATIFCG